MSTPASPGRPEDPTAVVPTQPAPEAPEATKPLPTSAPPLAPSDPAPEPPDSYGVPHFAEFEPLAAGQPFPMSAPASSAPLGDFEFSPADTYEPDGPAAPEGPPAPAQPRPGALTEAEARAKMLPGGSGEAPSSAAATQEGNPSDLGVPRDTAPAAPSGPATAGPATPPVPPPPPHGQTPNPTYAQAGYPSSSPYPAPGGYAAPTPPPPPPPYGAGPGPAGAQGGPPTAYGGYPSPYGRPGVDPYAKSRVVAGILGILLGGLGVHRFYLGYVGIGIAQIVVTVVTLGVGSIWGFIEGILYLTQRTGSYSVDATGRPLRD